MRDVTRDNFGPLIAYIVPGGTVLLGFSQFSPVLRSWLAGLPPNAPTLGGFLYLTLASLAVGMTVSAVRWGIVDTLHAWTGIPLPRLDFSRLADNVAAFHLLIEIHYQHYQFYANMLVATAIAYVCYRVRVGDVLTWGGLDAGALFLEVVFYLASRDTLWKYYTRAGQLLAQRPGRTGGKRAPERSSPRRGQ